MTQQINLLSPKHRKEPVSFSSPRSLACGLAAVLALSLIFAVYEVNRARAIEKQAASVAASLAQAGSARDDNAQEQANRAASAELAARVRELEAQLSARQEIVDALRKGLVGTTDGFSEYMRVFARQKLEGVWLTGFEIASGGEELTIAGRALNPELVPVYLQRLNREAPIRGRQFASVSINESSSATREQASGSANPVAEPAGAHPRGYVEFTMGTADPLDRARSGAVVPRSSPSVSMRARAEDAERTLRSGK